VPPRAALPPQPADLEYLLVATSYDRERVRVAVRIDTDEVVQLVCEHPRTDLQPKRWGTQPVSVWG
jgi:hypothetical protein